MTDDQKKKPGVAFWATVVVVVVLLAYPVGLGPLCWITSRTSFGASAVSIIYRPLTSGISYPGSHYERIQHTFVWYTTVGAAPNWGWVSTSDQPEWHWMDTTRVSL
jgi:hypothetical protein